MIISDLQFVEDVNLNEETQVEGGWYAYASAYAGADALAIGYYTNTYTGTYTNATAVAGVFSASSSDSYSSAEAYY
jgi:hypothetical protein